MKGVKQLSQPARTHRLLRTLSRSFTACGCIFFLSGCGAGTVSLEPAPDAANPVCAYALVAMPETLTGFPQRETTAQATTAWGDPATIVLKCGVSVSEPVSDPCVEVNGIDWILRPQEAESDPAKAASATASSHNTAPANSASPAAPQKAGTSTPAPVRTSNVQRSGGVWTATTYGRTPAIEVTFDADKVPSSTLLTSLSSAVKQVPAQKKCTNLNEVPGGH